MSRQETGTRRQLRNNKYDASLEPLLLFNSQPYMLDPPPALPSSTDRLTRSHKSHIAFPLSFLPSRPP